MSTKHSGHVFLGVDPGAKGAGVTVGSANRIYQFSKMTDTEVATEFRCLAVDCAELGIALTAILEKLWLRPTDGKSSGGKLVTHYGMLKGILLTVPIRTIEVAPVTWTRKLGRTDPKGTSKPVKKRLNQQLAQMLYPDRKVILETADAFLLAEYGRRFHQ
jgi:hypothetical protein